MAENARTVGFSSFYDSILYKQPEASSEHLERRWCKISVGMIVVAIAFNAAVTCTAVAWVVNPQLFSSTKQEASKDSLEDPLRIRAFTLTVKKCTEAPRRKYQHRICGWKANERVEGINLTDDMFYMTSSKGGVFQLYSHLAFTANSPKLTETLTQKIIALDSQDMEIQNITDQATVECQAQNGSSHCYNSVLFSTVRLNKNDKVYLQTSHLYLLDTNSEHSFFGIYRIE